MASGLSTFTGVEWVGSWELSRWSVPTANRTYSGWIFCPGPACWSLTLGLGWGAYGNSQGMHSRREGAGPCEPPREQDRLWSWVMVRGVSGCIGWEFSWRWAGGVSLCGSFRKTGLSTQWLSASNTCPWGSCMALFNHEVQPQGWGHPTWFFTGLY